MRCRPTTPDLFVHTVLLRAAVHSEEGRARIAAALRELEESRYLRRVVHKPSPPPPATEPAPTDAAASVPAPTGRTALAARLLGSLGRTHPRLTLGATEALQLAPLVTLPSVRIEGLDFAGAAAVGKRLRAAATGAEDGDGKDEADWSRAHVLSARQPPHGPTPTMRIARIPDIAWKCRHLEEG